MTYKQAYNIRKGDIFQEKRVKEATPCNGSLFLVFTDNTWKRIPLTPDKRESR